MTRPARAGWRWRPWLSAQVLLRETGNDAVAETSRCLGPNVQMSLIRDFETKPRSSRQSGVDGRQSAAVGTLTLGFTTTSDEQRTTDSKNTGRLQARLWSLH